VVPDDTIQHHDSQRGVSRGGSVKADNYPGGVSITNPVSATSPESIAPPAAVTEAEAPVEASTKPKKEKRHKKHKVIAKKLKVSCCEI
jgi:hypothetical protein